MFQTQACGSPHTKSEYKIFLIIVRLYEFLKFGNKKRNKKLNSNCKHHRNNYTVSIGFWTISQKPSSIVSRFNSTTYEIIKCSKINFEYFS